MSAAKFTPGPWAHDTTGFPKPDVRAASGRAVATTWMVCSNAPKTRAGFLARQAEDRANARLIAATPELLGALVEFVEAFESHKITNTHGARDFDFTGRIAALARAAIAKATGSVL